MSSDSNGSSNRLIDLNARPRTRAVSLRYARPRLSGATRVVPWQTAAMNAGSTIRLHAMSAEIAAYSPAASPTDNRLVEPWSNDGASSLNLL
jgi:hypothetical protein